MKPWERYKKEDATPAAPEVAQEEGPWAKFQGKQRAASERVAGMERGLEAARQKERGAKLQQDYPSLIPSRRRRLLKSRISRAP